jgi:hypothetical protein
VGYVWMNVARATIQFSSLKPVVSIAHIQCDYVMKEAYKSIFLRISEKIHYYISYSSEVAKKYIFLNTKQMGICKILLQLQYLNSHIERLMAVNGSFNPLCLYIFVIGIFIM